MLKAEERSILFCACAGHPVAYCGWCLRGFKPAQLAYNLRAPMQGFLCPDCRRDVTASQELVGRGEVSDTDARLWHPWLRINRGGSAWNQKIPHPRRERQARTRAASCGIEKGLVR